LAVPFFYTSNILLRDVSLARFCRTYTHISRSLTSVAHIHIYTARSLLSHIYTSISLIQEVGLAVPFFLYEQYIASRCMARSLLSHIYTSISFARFHRTYPHLDCSLAAVARACFFVYLYRLKHIYRSLAFVAHIYIYIACSLLSHARSLCLAPPFPSPSSVFLSPPSLPPPLSHLLVLARSLSRALSFFLPFCHVNH